MFIMSASFSTALDQASCFDGSLFETLFSRHLSGHGE